MGRAIIARAMRGWMDGADGERLNAQGPETHELRARTHRVLKSTHSRFDAMSSNPVCLCATPCGLSPCPQLQGREQNWEFLLLRRDLSTRAYARSQLLPPPHFPAHRLAQA
jgi:hypothetical protein